ncbi:MAG: FAD-dependent oxidoreductase, partial [Parvibaculaceae bacterium]
MPAASKLDLRGGSSVWDPWSGCQIISDRLTESRHCQILIIGSGITGAFLAERLSRLTSSIIVVDRHRPQTASTAASTSLLQWELDTPLRELSVRLGATRAVEIYRASVLAVRDIVTLSRELGIACHCIERPSLYLAGNRLGPDELEDEQKQREAA